jgi:hypothetical protein
VSFENHPSATAQFQVINGSAAPLYASNFNGSANGWVGSPSGVVSVGFGNADAVHRGAPGISVSMSAVGDGAAPIYEMVAKRTVTGLTVGKTYVFSAWGKSFGSPTNLAAPGSPGAGLGLRISVTGNGQSAWRLDVQDTWRLFSLAFVATATSHELFIETSSNGGNYSYWNTMDLSEGVDPLPVSEGTLTLDKGVAPYGRASVTVPLMDEDLLERLDPYANQRVKIAAASDGHWIPGPPIPIDPALGYAETFASGLNGWTEQVGDVEYDAAIGRTAPGSMRLLQWSGVPEGRYALAGLTVGASYTVKAWAASRRPTASSTVCHFSLGVVGLGDTPYISLPVPATADVPGTFVQFSYTFTATATTHVLRARTNSTGLATNAMTQVDDITVEQITKLDVPVWVEDDARSFDLVMRNRVVNHADRTVDLDLATDEAILMTYAPLADDSGAFEFQSSLRAICNYVLGKASPGATLQAGGAADVPFRVYTDAINLLTDPRYQRTPGGGYAVSACSTLPDTTWLTPENIYGIHLYGNTAGNQDSYVALNNASSGLQYGLRAGGTYTFSATGSVRSAFSGAAYAGRDRRLAVFTRPTGSGPYTEYTSAPIPNVVETGASAGTRVSVTFTVPNTSTAEVQIRAYHGSANGSITWRAFRLSETDTYLGADNVSFFFGFTPATSEYGYSWTGAVNDSTSRRVALIDRAPELLVWNAGDDAWAFLEPLMTSSKLKLWADEQRRWWLTDPETYVVPGSVVAEVSNTVEGTDSMDADDGPALDGVIARFTWRDYNGDTRTRDDFAGSPGRVRVFEFDRPYPGPGTAAAIRRRYEGQKRTQEVTVPSDFRVTPGQAIAISLPGTADQAGKLQSVRWQLTEGVMDLGASGIADVLAD